MLSLTFGTRQRQSEGLFARVLKICDDVLFSDSFTLEFREWAPLRTWNHSPYEICIRSKVLFDFLGVGIPICCNIKPAAGLKFFCKDLDKGLF